MGILYENITKPVTTSQPCGYQCVGCGTHFTDLDYWYGLDLSWRTNEEDEMTITARELCDDCFNDFDLMKQIQDKIVEIAKLFPHAKITSGPAWGKDGFLSEY